MASSLLNPSSLSSPVSSPFSLPAASPPEGGVICSVSFVKDFPYGFHAHFSECSRNRPTACEKGRLRALLGEGRLSLKPFLGDAEDVEEKEDDLNFFDRLALAWQILFPIRKKATSNAEIAKQRLKMILISDRCCVNDDAKKQIVNNIVGALADFVEIESEDRVRLNVSADPDLGTVYSVSVPVRRVRPEFQESSNEMRNAELQDKVAEPVNTVEALTDLPELQDLQGDT